MRVGVLEDEVPVRLAARDILARDGHEVALFESAAQLLDAARERRCPEVILCDLELGEVRGDAVAAQALELDPSLRFVALTGHAGDEWIFSSLAAGFVGYVLKAEAFDALGAVVDEVARGGAPLSRAVARRVVARFHAAPSPAVVAPALSGRELEVLQLLADGFHYEQIALRLEISLASVRTYVRRLYAKLGANTKSEATAIALRARLIS